MYHRWPVLGAFMDAELIVGLIEDWEEEQAAMLLPGYWQGYDDGSALDCGENSIGETD